MIRLVCSDLDGTLLEKGGVLPDGIFDAVRALKKKGVLFAPASGRQYDNLRSLFAPVRDEIAYICENGTLTVADGQKMGCGFFPEEVARQVIHDILSLDLQLLLSVQDACLVLDTAPRSYTDDIVYRLRNTTRVIHDPMIYAGEAIKISGFAAEGLGDRARILQEKWRPVMHCDAVGPYWVDFTYNCKGDGIRALCDHYGIAPEEIAAFGDAQNDRSMLEMVGHPFVMESGDLSLLNERARTSKTVLGTLKELFDL